METIRPIGGAVVKKESLRIGDSYLYSEPLTEYTGIMRLVKVKGFIGSKVWIESPHVGVQTTDVKHLFQLK